MKNVCYTSRKSAFYLFHDVVFARMKNIVMTERNIFDCTVPDDYKKIVKLVRLALTLVLTNCLKILRVINI